MTQVCRPWPKGPIEQMGYSLRTEKFRYTQWIEFSSGKILAEELYDHATDPLERKNLINNSSQVSDIVQFRLLMKEYR